MRHAPTDPALPIPLARLMRPLPLLPLCLALQRVVENFSPEKAGLFARLGEHADKVFLVDPTDIPFVLNLKLHRGRPAVEPRRRGQAGTWVARTTELLAALIGVLHGVYDGDALFFSRDIVIESDTEAVLALRNAPDDAEIDIATGIVGAFGPARSAVGFVASRLAGGIPLHGLQSHAYRWLLK